MKTVIISIITAMVVGYTIGYATIINIPADYPTIQQGIYFSVDGDTVLVQPGTYFENIHFNGHNIVLGSLFLVTGDTSFISGTVIDGEESGSVVTIINHETEMAVITGFTITNGSTVDGGGILCMYSNPKIIYNKIVENADTRYGGGIYCQESNPLVKNNIISNNNGSGIFCHSRSNPIIVNNIFDGNSGGGVRCKDNSNPTVLNNIITNNLSRWGGGGLYSRDSSPILINNVIFGNQDSLGGCGVFCRGSIAPIIVSSIIWGNGPDDNFEIYADQAAPIITYSNIRGGWEGQGNIDTDPLFRDPTNGDFHLMSTECGDPYDSPCIDYGSPAIIDSLLDCSWGLGTILSDMGAYGGGDSVTVGIDNFVDLLPERLALLQNYPNPFNASTNISFTLPEPSDIAIEIYNILGQRVDLLFEGNKQAGAHSIVWNASNVASGTYLYKINAGHFSETKRLTLLK